MARIEGEFSGFDPEKVKFDKGILLVEDGKAEFLIGQGNEHVFISVGSEEIHVFSYPGFEIGRVSVSDRSLRTANFGRLGGEGKPALLSAYNVTQIIDKHVPKGGSVEIERDGVYSLRVENKG